MTILLTLIIIFALLCFNEYWWQSKKHSSELSRKFIHISIGTYTAFWPFYLSFTDVKLLALAYLVVVSLSKRFNIFKSVHSVERTTWGEICFALSVGLLAFLTTNKWLYSASLLQMALADGLAAVVGVAYGKKSRYKVLGQIKSLIGSLTFFIVSLIILMIFKETGHLPLSPLYLALTSLIATCLENIGVKGLDNLLVPIVVLLLLNH